MKINCPSCGQEQEENDLFCTNCGTRLAGGLSTNKLEPSKTLPVPVGKTRLNLHIIRGGQILPLPGPAEYIIGRVSEGQSILPDVDLEPYAAYESGVSRLHARIHIENHAMWITDLGSSNGTRINNEKLTPHRNYPLTNKDIVRFGRLSVQALVGKE